MKTKQLLISMLAAFSLQVGVAACVDTDDDDIELAEPSDEADADAGKADGSVSLTVLSVQPKTNSTTPYVKVIKSRKQYLQVFGVEPTDIDFRNENVAVFAAGLRNTGGFKASIPEIRRTSNGVLSISARVDVPFSDCIVTQALTFPTQTVKFLVAYNPVVRATYSVKEIGYSCSDDQEIVIGGDAAKTVFESMSSAGLGRRVGFDSNASADNVTCDADNGVYSCNYRYLGDVSKTDSENNTAKAAFLTLSTNGATTLTRSGFTTTEANDLSCYKSFISTGNYYVYECFFKPSQSEAQPSQCNVGGCSGQICSDEEGLISTCEFRPEYACYAEATCERQNTGECGWTPTAELTSCIDNAR